MGIASLVLGIVSLIIGFMPFYWLISSFPAIIGLILGIISLCQKKSKGLSIAGIVLCAIVLILVAITYNDIDTNLTSTTSTNIETGKQETTNNEDLKQNIVVEPIGLTENGDFAFKVINNNNQTVFLDTVNTVFKDENDVFMEKVQSQSQFFGIGANSEIINYAWGYDKDFSKYPKQEFEVELSSNYMSSDKVVDNFELKANNTGKQIAVEVQNNNPESLSSIQILVAYYQNGKIVGCQTGYNNESTSANGKAYINVNFPENKNYEEIKFDDYKAYLVCADKN